MQSILTALSLAQHARLGWRSHRIVRRSEKLDLRADVSKRLLRSCWAFCYRGTPVAFADLLHACLYCRALGYSRVPRSHSQRAYPMQHSAASHEHRFVCSDSPGGATEQLISQHEAMCTVKLPMGQAECREIWCSRTTVFKSGGSPLWASQGGWVSWHTSPPRQHHCTLIGPFKVY